MHIGSNIDPEYDESLPVKADGTPIELYGYLAICTGDIDSDGDNDLVVGNAFQLICFLNTGTSISPKLTKGRILKTINNQDPFGIYVRPKLADWDGDGKTDII